jgi:glycosyltransferase involved in cell wall biosynthesis
MSIRITFVIPAKNESQSIGTVISSIRSNVPTAEIIVVDDGSTDRTGEIAASAGARVVKHAYSLGNGGAIKSGARAAKGDIIVFMDADGQHSGEDIHRLLEKIDEGFDMAVGARTDASQAGHGRRWANRIYNWFASYMTGQRVPDLTSGFRAVRAAKFREFLYLLPNGFSYPTTITMAFFRAGYQVAYVPFTAGSRTGKSHINPIRDGIRFLLIIFRIGSLYSPLKLFFPIALLHGALGISYYAYTYLSAGRLSLATMFLLTAGVTIFLIGLVSEQITALMYRDPHKEH